MTTKTDKSMYPKPHTVGSVTVRVTDESEGQRKKFRVRWYIGSKRDSETFTNAGKADTFAIKKATDLNNEFRPPSRKQLAELQRKAILVDDANDRLLPFGFDLPRGVSLLEDLLKEMGGEGIRLFSTIYGPRVASVRPMAAKLALQEYQKFQDRGGSVTQDHLDNLGGCFKKFGAKFGDRNINDIEADAIDGWMGEQELSAGTWDKWLYALRGLFTYARDYKKALPQMIPHECDLVQRRRADKAPPEVFSLEEIDAIAKILPDQETMLAFVLILFGHLRQDEAQELTRAHFGFSNQEIGVTAEIAKHKKGQKPQPRDIPIKPILAQLLPALLPDSGPIFVSKDVYERLRKIVKAAQIDWKHNALRHCCTSYAVAAGEDIKDVAKFSGHTVAVLKRNYLVPVEPADAEKYWAMTFDLERLRQLPRRHQLSGEKIKQNARKYRPAKPEQIVLFELAEPQPTNS